MVECPKRCMITLRTLLVSNIGKLTMPMESEIGIGNAELGTWNVKEGVPYQKAWDNIAVCPRVVYAPVTVS